MKVDYQILSCFLEDKGAPIEKGLVNEWFRELSVEDNLKSFSFQYWQEMSIDKIPEDYNENLILGKIYRQMKLDENIPLAKKRPVGLKILNVVSKIAAVLFIPLFILFITDRSKGTVAEAEIIYAEIYSPLGSRTKFYLPDGSKGWLNGGSSLKFPEKFEKNKRSVTLNGEAYFDIVSNPKRPFEVNMEKLKVIAKGTIFNVRCYKEEKETEVVLEKGIVEVKSKKSYHNVLSSHLAPGQLFNYKFGDSDYIVKNVDAQKYTAWIKGKLIFADDPLNDVVTRLNRWFNVNIEIKDNVLKGYRYVATFQDEPLSEILKMLELSAPIKYREIKRRQDEDGTFQKRTIYLYYKK